MEGLDRAYDDNLPEKIKVLETELEGDQKNFYYRILDNFFPDLVSKYRKLYGDSYKPDDKYILGLNKNIKKYCKEFSIPNKIQ